MSETPKTYNFPLTEPEANTIIQILSEQPYKLTAKLIHKMQGQYMAQQADDAAQGESSEETQGAVEES